MFFLNKKYISNDLKSKSPERNSFEFSEYDTLLVFRKERILGSSTFEL